MTAGPRSRPESTTDECHMIVPGPSTPPSTGVSPTPTWPDPFVPHLNEHSAHGGPGAAKPTPADRAPPPSLLDRLNADQRNGTSAAKAAGVSPIKLCRSTRNSPLGTSRPYHVDTPTVKPMGATLHESLATGLT